MIETFHKVGYSIIGQHYLLTSLHVGVYSLPPRNYHLLE